MAEVLAEGVGDGRLGLHVGRCHHRRGRLVWVLVDAFSFGLDGCDFALDVSDAAAALRLVLVFLFGFRVIVFLLLLGDARLAARGCAISLLRLQAEDLLSEARKPHAGGMSVGDLLGQDWVAGHLVPIDLSVAAWA